MVSNSLKHKSGCDTTESFVTSLSGLLDSQPTQEKTSEKDTEETQIEAFTEVKAKMFSQYRERATQLSSQVSWTSGPGLPDFVWAGGKSHDDVYTQL